MCVKKSFTCIHFFLQKQTHVGEKVTCLKWKIKNQQKIKRRTEKQEKQEMNQEIKVERRKGRKTEECHQNTNKSEKLTKEKRKIEESQRKTLK